MFKEVESQNPNSSVYNVVNNYYFLMAKYLPATTNLKKGHNYNSWKVAARERSYIQSNLLLIMVLPAWNVPRKEVVSIKHDRLHWYPPVWRETDWRDEEGRHGKVPERASPRLQYLYSPAELLSAEGLVFSKEMWS